MSELVYGTTPDEDRDLARRYQGLRDTGYVFTRTSPFSFKVTHPDGTTEEAGFLCLPDTVDPRGPKGK